MVFTLGFQRRKVKRSPTGRENISLDPFRGDAYGGTRLLPGAQQAKSPNSEFVFDEGRDWLAGIALWKAVEVWNLEEGSPLQGSTPNTLGRRSRGRQWRSTSGTNWTANLSAG